MRSSSDAAMCASSTVRILHVRRTGTGGGGRAAPPSSKAEQGICMHASREQVGEYKKRGRVKAQRKRSKLSVTLDALPSHETKCGAGWWWGRQQTSNIMPNLRHGGCIHRIVTGPPECRWYKISRQGHTPHHNKRGAPPKNATVPRSYGTQAVAAAAKGSAVW